MVAPHLCDSYAMPCRPTSVKPGPKVVPPFSETWEALEKCVEEGLIKSIGVSNFSPEKIETFMPGAKIRPAVNQVYHHHPVLHALRKHPIPSVFLSRTAVLFSH